MEVQESKLACLIHYIVWKCSDPTLLGATKLNKVLWYADAFAYMERRTPITGVTYVKRPFGPAPRASVLFAAQQSLQRAGKIAITEGVYYDKPQRQFVALQRPDISEFSSEEISIVDLVIDKICHDHMESSISKATHMIIWEAAEIGEEIPLHALFATHVGELTEDDIQWARAEAMRLGLGR